MGVVWGTDNLQRHFSRREASTLAPSTSPQLQTGDTGDSLKSGVNISGYLLPLFLPQAQENPL